MKMLVLGAGLQGSACAFELLRHPEVTRVTLADLHPDGVASFLSNFDDDQRLVLLGLDVTDHEAVRGVMADHDAVMSAIPYYFNGPMAKLAVEAGCHFADLGGNTEIVMEQKKLDEAARAKGLSIMPDCGLAPGMVNILAAEGIRRLDAADRVRIYVGGLPQHPKPPLNYQIVYSLEGALDYYTTPSWILRDGKAVTVDALSELEDVSFPAPVGKLEAFHTAGGISTMPFAWEGKVREMEYKTLRYPGHVAIMRPIRELGLLGNEPITVKGHKVVPRDVFIATVSPKLTNPKGEDLVALRVVVSGTKDGAPKTTTFDLIDYADETHGISAMMRTTGYSLAITGLIQAQRQVIRFGVTTPDEGMPYDRYVAALGERGVNIQES
ncbi:MAG TPA: saccharopine dehydrogenase C-terminal domain-containing protein [Gemmatimonadales bacterium]|nr:saccharopine dehydrogenase NADP-binding domain-containing protein [Gemmatimonadota bacterium]HPF61055.1 saccharopine dehydrogenase C-terminal domain-containing protein [Gemmatimonadales bacterium]HRX17865.1 saccharopine dehydrogenase C-terminal domain-containing protein [Gemmatimonadales bacterium]